MSVSHSQDSQTQNQGTTTERIRKNLLFTILAVMIAAITYDYGIARPSVNHAYDDIANECVRVNATRGAFFTDQSVRQILGKQPAAEFSDGDYLVEQYHYKGGLPGKPHKLFAVYKSVQGKKLFYRHAKFAYEKSFEVATISTAVVNSDSDPDVRSDTKLSNVTQASIAQANVAQAHADAMNGFEALDANKDGKLTVNEVPAGLRYRMNVFDSDSDGSVSVAEVQRMLDQHNARQMQERQMQQRLVRKQATATER